MLKPGVKYHSPDGRTSILCIVLLLGFACLMRGQSTEQRFRDWSSLQFDKQEYETRRQALITLLKGEGNIFICPSRESVSHGETFRQTNDFLYFTGLELPNSMLVIDAKSNEVIIFTPDLDPRFENPSRKNDFPGRPLALDPHLSDLSGIMDIRSSEKLGSYLEKKIKSGTEFTLNFGRSGDPSSSHGELDYSRDIPEALIMELQSRFPEILIRNGFTEIASLRMVKSAAEIEVMKKAAEITVTGIKEAAGSIRSGIDERSLEAVLEGSFKRGGAQRLAFASIIKSGPNSLWPWRILAAHYDRRNRIMHKGELVIFDVGCEYNYYSSDVGRTFPVSGKFTKKQKMILEMQLAVADAIIAAIRPGISLHELTQVAIGRIPLDHQKYMQAELFFGHHIGLSAGDPALPEVKLLPGMIFTVEPWYYNHDENVAVFTEDIILVTESGCEVLTKSLPRSPSELEKMVTGVKKF